MTEMLYLLASRDGFENCCRARVEVGKDQDVLGMRLFKGKLAAGLCSLSCGWREAMTSGHGISRVPGGRNTLI